MKSAYEIGDLVHIPQAVRLMDFPQPDAPNGQLAIPSRIHETTAPTLGLVAEKAAGGYLKVLCEGDRWSVLNSSVYKLGGEHD
jgi:hypothetical protein